MLSQIIRLWNRYLKQTFLWYHRTLLKSVRFLNCVSLWMGVRLHEWTRATVTESCQFTLDLCSSMIILLFIVKGNSDSITLSRSKPKNLKTNLFYKIFNLSCNQFVSKKSYRANRTFLVKKRLCIHKRVFVLKAVTFQNYRRRNEQEIENQK